MSLSNATWQEFSRASNLQETWVVHLYYDAAGASDYLEISDRDFMDGGVQALGVIQSMGEIRREIDLMKYTASVDNMTITLANVVYHGAPLADELKPGATRKYQNRKVQVYSILNGNAGTKMQVYNGRLMGMSWTADEITLDIEQAQPWDYLSFPDIKTTGGRYFPAVYGDFTPNSSTVDAQAYCTSMALWPAKVYEVGETNIRALAHEECGSSARPHVYEQSIDQFVPITDSTSAYYDTAADFENGKIIVASTEYYLGFKGKGQFRDSTDNDWTTDPLNAVDYPREDDTFLTSSDLTIIGNPFSGIERFYTFDFPTVSAEFYGDKTITVYIWFNWTTSNADQTLDLALLASGSMVGAYDSVAATGGGFHTSSWTLSSGTSIASLSVSATVVSGTVQVNIVDIRISGKAKLSTTDKQTRLNTLEKVEQVYCGADGLGRSWTTGAVTLIHELHRDILHRVAGHTTAPENYSALDSARTLWTVRWWLHDQEPVKDLLEQAQFEGAFVFIWSMTTTGTGRYLFVKSSYTSADVVATLNELRDTTGITYSHTPFSDLITKQSIRYQRHPAEEGRYISSYEFTNSTSRTAWNIQADENVESVELDMLVAEVDTWAEIRDSIVGDLKQIVECDIINPLHFIVEIGDVIQIENDSRYYMVVGERRTPGRLSITAREVYA